MLDLRSSTAPARIVNGMFGMKVVTNMKYYLLLGMFISNFCLSAGWSGETTINGIYVLNETTAIIQVANFSNPDGCKVNEAGHIYFNPSENKIWLSLILTAYASKSKVDIYVDNCQSVWGNEYTFANAVHVRLK